MNALGQLLMGDSTTAADIPPAELDAVAGYGDGLYEWSSEDWARFGPRIVPVSIVVDRRDQGDVLDVETGAAAPTDTPLWVAAYNRPARPRPTVYVNRVNWPHAVTALGDNGLDPRQVDWWVSTLDGTLDAWYGSPGAHPPTGLQLVAVQWKGEALTGGHWDESIIVDPSWIGLPVAAPYVPAPIGEWEWWGASGG